MATFGRYETVREISVTGIGSVWTARLGDAAQSFVVKTYQPAANVLTEEQIARGAKSFLESARSQQQVAGSVASGASGRRHWAPVHESGEIPGGAYYVTDHYAWSVKKLTAGRVTLDAAGLYGIADGIAKGLGELKSVCGRPHGNLKSSNVLLDGPPGSGPTRVFLSDPSDPSRVGGDGAEANDLYALGQMLFELVTQRPAKRMMAWPIAPSPEWLQLGAKGDGWRELCNQLLHPVPEESLRRLDDLHARLAALAVGGRRGGKRRVFAGAAAVAVLLVSALSATYFLRPGLFHRKQVTVIPGTDIPVALPQTRPTGGTSGVPQPQSRPTGVAVIPGTFQQTSFLAGGEPPNEHVERVDLAKIFAQWAAKITPPAVQSPVLRSAWEAARKKQFAGRTAPDPAVKARLEELRDDLQSLERDLSTVNTSGTQAAQAAAEREELFRKAADAVEHDASAVDPNALVWTSLRREYDQWLKRQADVRHAGELLREAEGQKAQGNDRAALNKLDEVLNLDAQNPQALAIQKQILDAEEATLAEARALDASNDRNDLQRALAKLGELLNRDPDQAEAKRLRDSVSSRMDSARAADTMLKSAKDQQAQGNDGAALETLERLLKLDARNPQALAAKSEILSAESAILADAAALDDQGNLPAALDKLEDLLKRNPGRDDAKSRKQDVQQKLTRGWLNSARAKADLGDWQEWQNALALLDQVDKFPRKDDQAAQLRKSIETRMQNRLKVNLRLTDAGKLEGAGDWKGALENYQAALQLEPDNADVKNRLSTAAEKVKAIELVSRLLAQAQGQIAAGDLDGAAATLRRLDPNQPDAQRLSQVIRTKREEQEKVAQARVLALSQEAQRYENAGNPTKALEVLQGAENDRVKSGVKPLADEIRARIASALVECNRGDALFAQQDYAKALAAYQRSAQGGYVPAMLHLGGMYLNAMGSAKDAAEAASWFQRAADRGNADAMYFLAGLYEQGQGVKPSAEMANVLYKKAADMGSASAKSRLAALRPAPPPPPPPPTLPGRRRPEDGIVP